MEGMDSMLLLTRQMSQQRTCLRPLTGYDGIAYVNDSEKKAHVSKNIRRFREELGATQQEVADRAGITVFSISCYEQGGEPGRDQLLKLASAFARPVEHFYMKDPPAADPLTQRVWSVR